MSIHLILECYRMSCGIRSSVLSIMSTVSYKILSDKEIY